MIEGPIGAAAFNNEFGRPNLAGYFRTFEQEFNGEMRGYHKPIMIAGGVGNIADRDAFKIEFPAGTLLIQLGGPGMLIGLGGGAASSMATGTNTADLDFASVQRGNPEMQRRAQEVIDRCWQMGDDNPILAIHDVGAGGISNAMPELANDAGRGAPLRTARRAERRAGHVAARNLVQRGAGALRAGHRARSGWTNSARSASASAAPSPCSARRPTSGNWWSRTDHFGNKPVDMPMEVLLGKPPRMHRNAHARKSVAMPPLDVARHRPARRPHSACCACRRWRRRAS